MRVAVLGGGPAGLYFASLLKRHDPSAEVTVFERNAADATYGWGVVFSDRTLTAFRDADPVSYDAITRDFVTWDAIDVGFGGERLRCGGHSFAGISRKRLLQSLARRCAARGVDLRFQTEVTDLSPYVEHDLLVAADGVNSTVRRLGGDAFAASIAMGRSRYIWLGTPRVFGAFSFFVRETDDGFFQAHMYPFDGQTSTFIVECDEASWRRAGLDTADEAASLAYCARLFAPELDGAPLLSNRSLWLQFPTLSCGRWSRDRTVLIGDACHTAHFSIGSGTKLAMEDAIALAGALARTSSVDAALHAYEEERRPIVERLQAAAAESQTYFENLRRYRALPPSTFAFNLLTRSGRIGYDDLRLRDAAFVDEVDSRFAERKTAIAPPPVFTPYDAETLRVPSRVVRLVRFADAARDGAPGAAERRAFEDTLRLGAGLVITPPVAVTADGRITSGCTGLYEDAHTEAWASLVERAHGAGVRVGVVLSHAGRRGSTRPRSAGLDRPLRSGGWALLAPSARPYARQGTAPRAATTRDLAEVRAAFAAATRRAAAAGFDVVLVHMAHGYLLGSFLSPLSNERTDDYGGALANRMRYPLAVFDTVRAAWAADRAAGVVLLASDCRAGGFNEDDAVGVARALRARGCGLAMPLAGQTIPGAHPRYGRAFLARFADRLRNEAGVPVLAAGFITRARDANTLLAAGRADLCLLEAANVA